MRQLFFSLQIIHTALFRYDRKFKLYPADIEMQAIINQRLWFDNGTLFKTARDIFVSEVVLAQVSLVLTLNLLVRLLWHSRDRRRLSLNFWTS